MSSGALSAGADFAVRRRHDLIVRLKERRGGRVWTLKDPVGLRYYQLNDEEFWIYEQLDGRTSLVELRKAFERRFAASIR